MNQARAGDWICIATYAQPIEAEMARARLQSEDIPCQVVNRVDSFYPTIGFVQLFVPQTEALKAKFILETHQG